MRLSPYESSCSFLSQVFDADSIVTWDTMIWASNTPAGTSVSLSYRIGNTPVPDMDWTEFITVPSSGSFLYGNSRYIQYRVVENTSDPSFTPVLEDVRICYTLGVDTRVPLILNRFPQPNAINIPTNTDIIVSFSEPMNTATLNEESFTLHQLGSETDLRVTLIVYASIVSSNPDADLLNGVTYEIRVDGAITDVAGNPLGFDSIWTFDTTSLSVIDDTVASLRNSGQR